jgi:hypothetical protein
MPKLTELPPGMYRKIALSAAFLSSLSIRLVNRLWDSEEWQVGWVGWADEPIPRKALQVG